MQSWVSEVASAGESFVSSWPRALTDGDPLRSGVDDLHARPVGDLEFHAGRQVAVVELGDGPIETLDAANEDWLVALEMAGEQELGRIRGQAHNRHACADGLDGEYDLAAQPFGEVRLGRRRRLGSAGR